jgi:hypothetical protein
LFIGFSRDAACARCLQFVPVMLAIALLPGLLSLVVLVATLRIRPPALR